MKSLRDYEGEEAFELWADLMEPIVKILQDDNVKDVLNSGASKIRIATVILKSHKAEAAEIMERIDPDEPVNGLNIIIRLMRLLTEIGSDPVLASFFGLPGLEKMEQEYSG